MRLYRVCNKIEADCQIVGQAWQRPPDEHKNIRYADAPGLYATRYPEMWRRIFNKRNEDKALKQLDNWYDHTLLLEVPDDANERILDYIYEGSEYVIADRSKVIVMGVTGPAWPVADWLPQPTDRNQWNPYSVDFEEPRYIHWQPRDGSKVVVKYSKTEEQLREQRDGALTHKLRELMAGHTLPWPDHSPDMSTSNLVAHLHKVLHGDFPTKTLLSEYRTQKEWFTEPEQARGRNGIDHHARVLLLTELLTRQLSAQEDYSIGAESLRWAAATHDIKRLKNDKDYDQYHGQRAAIWASDHFEGRYDELTLRWICYHNYWHTWDSEQVPYNTFDFCILKDANNLDKVRYPSIFNKSFMRLQQAKMYPNLAKDLYEQSKQKQQKGADLFESVLAAGVSMGIVKDE
jgi:hypothetical protein